MTPFLRKILGLNWFLFFNMLIILAIGVAGIYSATYFRDGDVLQNLWQKQIYWIGIGLVGYFFIALIDYKWARYWALPAYLLALGLLLFLRFGPDSMIFEKDGARSWIKLKGSMTFQPSQVAIFVGIAFLSYILAFLPRTKKLFARYPILLVAIVGIVAGIPFLLILTESDIGSASVWGPVVIFLIISAGLPFRYIITLILSALIVLPLVYFFLLKDYQKTRIETWLRMVQDKPVDLRDKAWASNNNLIAIGSAGLLGKGFKAKKSMTKLNFIPKDVAISDYLFVVLAEEHGFKGVILLLTCYATLFLQIILTAFYSRDHMGLIMCAGVTGLLICHVFQNMGMSLLLVPITGIPLPLVSYGGTFTCIAIAMLGLVQSVWVHRKFPTGAIDMKF